LGTPVHAQREVAIPAAAFAALSRALRTEGGALAAIHGLHAAGYGAGEALYRRLFQGRENPADQIAEPDFWRLLSRFMSKRGWGTLIHSAPHPGVGFLISPDWAEADDTEGMQPSCAFTVGLLAHLLTRVASAPVAVLEVTCRTAGHSACTFAFGSEATIHDLYGLLLEGKEMDRALAEL
jgi:predicted hydrocarbon binding protein